jgi:RNA polymerase sigma factor (sigma-70 family)
VLSAERISAVRRALAELPPSQREAIRLRIEEGLDHVQIAERLGINRQAVEVRLCKGRAALRERLVDIFEGDL